LTLIKKGANVNEVDEDGNTPLAIALHAKQSGIKYSKTTFIKFE